MKSLQKLVLATSMAALLAACGGGGSDPVAVPTPTPTPVVASGTVRTSLSLATVSAINPTTLTITFANVAGTAISGAAFTIPLPAGGKGTTAFGAGTPCTSTGYTLGNTGFTLTGLSIPAGATCTNVITLTPSAAAVGTHVFTPTGLTNMTAGTVATLVVQ